MFDLIHSLQIEKKLNEAFGYKVIKEAEKSEKTDDSFRTALSEIGSPGRRPPHQVGKFFTIGLNFITRLY